MRLQLIATVLVASAALAGCEEIKNPRYGPDQELRAEIFHSCLKSLPAGPISTKYNDWDEVVEACSSAAYYQSLYCYENCPPQSGFKKKGGAHDRL